MKRLHVALLTGLMLFSLTACGNKDTGIIIGAGDMSTNSESNIVVQDSTEQTESTEQVESAGTTENDKDNLEEFSLLGIWCSNNPNENVVYTFDNGNEFSLYQGSTDTYVFGTYETDNKTYVDVITEKKVESDTTETNEVNENGYVVESAESLDNTVETDTQRFSLEYSTFTNEYNQTFEMITLKNDTKEIQLIKTMSIEEKAETEISEEVGYIEESAEE